MKLFYFGMLITSFAIISCTGKSKQDSEKTNETDAYVIGYDNVYQGIMLERIDSSVTDLNKYNRDNTIYKVGSKFIYEYEIIDVDGKKKLFKLLPEDKRSWVYVDTLNNDSNTIKSIEYIIADGNPLKQLDPDYSQTVFMSKYSSQNQYSMSGIIENAKNVWAHPNRDDYFEILEINPFPYIKTPYEIGTSWKWNQTIGDQWADERWKIWSGDIENNYEYEITSKTKLDTQLGTLDCLVVESTAKSRIGKTALTAYFNEKHGFVKLDYTNIDGSKVTLKLIGHTEVEKSM